MAPAVHAQIIWNFGTSSGNAASSSDIPSNLIASAVTQNNNNGNTTMLSTSAPSSGYIGASGQYNAVASAVAGSLSLLSSTFFEFTLTPSTGYLVDLTEISFGTRSTSTGAANVEVYTSSDNFTTNILSKSVLTTGTWELATSGTLSSISGTSISPLVVRIYGFGGTGSTSTGNWRIDDISTSVFVTAVPEPSTYAAILGGVALVGVMVMRRRKSAAKAA